MLRQLLPPICFLFALAMAIVGFALIAQDGPDPSIDLHRAEPASITVTFLGLPTTPTVLPFGDLSREDESVL